jgi:hypothetical protein
MALNAARVWRLWLADGPLDVDSPSTEIVILISVWAVFVLLHTGEALKLGCHEAISTDLHSTSLEQALHMDRVAWMASEMHSGGGSPSGRD